VARRQRFDEPATELAYLDMLAAVDGLVARKAALDERLSRLALEGEWWPTVARLRCFRGIDTLTAFVLCLEIGDFHRFSHVLQIAWRAQHRLHRRYSRLRGRGKPGNIATVAVARELACFLWAAAVAA
jgi:hypothetical protein